MSLKTDYNSYNEDDFVEERGEMKELTVTITLCEYRNLIDGRARDESTINDLNDRLKHTQNELKLMTDVVMLDHPEFFGDVVDAVTKFLKKVGEPANG